MATTTQPIRSRRSPRRATPTPTRSSAPSGSPRISTIRTSAFSRATKTCCSTTPDTFPARSRSIGTPTSTTRSMRDYVSREQFQELLRSRSIDESTTVVFYGDKNNWWATYAFWVFQLFGFTNAKLLDGGRLKWEQEGRAMTTDVPRRATADRTTSRKRGTTQQIRAFMSDVRKHRRREGQAGRRALAR